MITSTNVPELFGAPVVDTDGDKVGSVGQVYLDSTDSTPTWVTVKTGLFGTSESFVPVGDATWADGELQIPFQKSFVKDAPRVADDGALSPDEESSLYAYYGHVDAAESADEIGSVDEVGSVEEIGAEDGAVGHDTSGPTTDNAMTRSEERLRVGTEKTETGRARLRKFVVTETETVTVPVSHEEITLQREPITDANIGDATAGPAISEEEHEIVLTGERVITSTETVPVERIRLDTETVTEQQTVSGDVRHEEVELVDPDSETRTSR